MRQSEYINKRQYDQLDHSIRFAAEIGVPLNTFVTIQFGATGCEPEDAGPAVRRIIRNRFTPWLRPTRGYPVDHRPAAWVYWLENVHEHDQHPHGTHAHWVVHVPPARRAAFEAKLGGWVESIAGTIFEPAIAIEVRDAERPRGLGRYAGKGLKPHDAKKRGLRPSPQGLIYGRRVSISEAINISAIAAHRDAIRAAAGEVRQMQSEPFIWPANDQEGEDQAPWQA